MDQQLASDVDLLTGELHQAGEAVHARLDALAEAWASEQPAEALRATLAADQAALAVKVDEGMTQLARTVAGAAEASVGSTERLSLLLAWAEGAARRRELFLFPIIAAGWRAQLAAGRLDRATRARILHGPFFDSLACVGFTAGSEWLRRQPEARGRTELLLWVAGGSALAQPELGRWLFRDPAAYDDLLLAGARGSLWQRSLAARLLAVAADGMPLDDYATAAQTERLVRALARHPEPLVWIAAARAMGRLAGRSPTMRATLQRWLDGSHAGERRRAITALASTPGDEETLIVERLRPLLEDGADPWAVAAIGPAVPHLASERRHLWEQLAQRLLTMSPRPELFWSVTQSLIAMYWRQEPLDRTALQLLAHARQLARAAQPKALTTAVLWRAVQRDTDFLDGLEPDPRDAELLLDKVIGNAVRLGGAQVADRARFHARAIGANFELALEAATDGDRSLSQRAQALGTMESCARAAALRPWVAVLHAGGKDPSDLADATRCAAANMADAAAKLLTAATPDYAIHRTALRILGWHADAAAAPTVADLDSERGRAAAFAVAAVGEAPWLKALSTRDAARFRKPVADVLWRAMDAVRGSALQHQDPMVMARFALWWSLAAQAPHLIELLERAEPSARAGETRICVELTTELREQLDASDRRVLRGDLRAAIALMLAHAPIEDTSLVQGLALLSGALEKLDQACREPAGAPLEQLFGQLAVAVVQLSASIANPELALGRPRRGEQNVADAAVLVKRAMTAISEGGRSPQDVAGRWAEGLGPVVGPLVETAVRQVVGAHVSGDAAEVGRRVGRYRLLKQLGGGSMGEVWLVAAETGRRFVMKIPLLAYGQADTEAKRRLADALASEGAILQSLYHPNIAHFIDYGWDGDTPFLVMERLVGMDLAEYAEQRSVGISELKPIVSDICTGLGALHSHGLVHRDLKPRNIFLRLDAPGVSIDADARDAAQLFAEAKVLSAVLIDMGISAKFSQVAATDALGTPGFMAPEQARGSTDLDARSDVYALAATIFAVMTGTTFFEEVGGRMGMMIAHATRDPLAEAPKASMLPVELLQLLREASTLERERRIDVSSFESRFGALNDR